MLAGRAKDTIVLSNGENVEPGPIEDACAASPYIQNLILWGQDHRMLGALVVPDAEAIEGLEKSQGGARARAPPGGAPRCAAAVRAAGRRPPLVCAGKLSEKDLKARIREEIQAAVQHRSKWEQIAAFVLLKVRHARVGTGWTPHPPCPGVRPPTTHHAQEPLSVEAGTITRTFKPRRDAVYARYSQEISQLHAQLR